MKFKSLEEKNAKLQELALRMSELSLEMSAVVNAEIEEVELITPPSHEGMVGNDFDLDANRLPDPPAEIIVDIPEDTSKKCFTYDEEVILGCAILGEFNIEYAGTASNICLHLSQFENGKTTKFLDRYHVTCEIYDTNGTLLASKYIHKDNLSKFPELVQLGLYTYNHINYEPKKIYFAL